MPFYHANKLRSHICHTCVCKRKMVSRKSLLPSPVSQIWSETCLYHWSLIEPIVDNLVPVGVENQHSGKSTSRASDVMDVCDVSHLTFDKMLNFSCSLQVVLLHKVGWIWKGHTRPESNRVLRTRPNEGGVEVCAIPFHASMSSRLV